MPEMDCEIVLMNAKRSITYGLRLARRCGEWETILTNNQKTLNYA